MEALNDKIIKMNYRGISPSHHVLLVKLNDLTISTAQQLCRATRSSKSLTTTQAKLKELCDEGYLHRQFLPRISPTGGSTYVYQLLGKARSYLTSLGIDVRIKKSNTFDYYRLIHTFAINDFILLAYDLDRFYPPIELRRWYHDYDLKKMLQGSPIPDAWVEFWTGKQRCIALELDRGTMDEKQMRTKVRSYANWVQGTYQKIFGATSLTVAVMVPTKARAQLIKRWVETELRTSPELAALFHIGVADLSSASPLEVFLTPSYLVPFQPEEVQLL